MVVGDGDLLVLLRLQLALVETQGAFQDVFDLLQSRQGNQNLIFFFQIFLQYHILNIYKMRVHHLGTVFAHGLQVIQLSLKEGNLRF